MRNLMSFTHRNFAVHSDVEIDIKIQSHLAGPAFLHLDNTRDRPGSPANGPDKFTARRGIHDLKERGPQQAVAVRADERAGNKRSPVICALPGFAANKCQGDTDKCCGGSHGINAMMPSISFYRGAFRTSSEPDDITIESFLHDHGHDQDRQRPRSRRMMR